MPLNMGTIKFQKLRKFINHSVSSKRNLSMHWYVIDLLYGGRGYFDVKFGYELGRKNH